MLFLVGHREVHVVRLHHNKVDDIDALTARPSAAPRARDESWFKTCSQLKYNEAMLWFVEVKHYGLD